WGVIHNGQTLYDGVAEALIEFRRARGPVIILTNAPRLSEVIPAQLDRLGLPREAYDAVVTSGDATRAAVAERANLPFFQLGPDKDQTLFDSLPVTFTPLEEAEAILCTGPFNDRKDTPEDYRGMLTQAAKQKLPMICANPDKVVKFGDQLIYCAGALGDVYEEVGGEVILCGKPHPPIYDLARKTLSDLKALPNARILVVGDGMQTDILGANTQDLDVVFVAEGIFSQEARNERGQLDPNKLKQLLSTYDVHAEYAMEGLTW
ncbi:MAG: TIGR01459 family HAD-type hydrolase, partial [Pseudomonadota bacterium]